MRLDFSFKINGDKSATQIGVVVTSTTELETLVYSNDVIHEEKCMASSKPAAAILNQSARRMARIPSLCRRRTKGVINSEASPSRKAAITSEGISCWAYRMNNDADDTARIPIPRINAGDLNQVVQNFFFGSILLDKGYSGE
jgi:hypothetical protein